MRTVSASDKLYAFGKLVEHLVVLLVKALVGLCALYLKLDSLEFLVSIPIGRWERKRWLAFAGFANQIAGLVPLDGYRKEVILQFIFTGEDAVLQPTEQHAMEQFNGMVTKHVFAACKGSALPLVDGLAAALSINAADVQKMVIVEGGADAAALRREKLKLSPEKLSPGKEKES